MISRARLTAAVALFVVGSLAAAAVAVGPVAAADARLALTDATVTPATPTAGAPMTAETTIRLSAGSDTPLTVEEVAVRDEETGEVLGTATDLGRLSPGETLTVPVAFTVAEPRSYDLRIVAVGTDSDGERTRAARPLTVGVERGRPQVELRTTGLVAGAETPIRAVVSNPTTAPLRGVELRVTNPETGERTRRTVPTLAAGGSATRNFSVRAASPGETSIELTTTYTTAAGVERTATATRTVPVAPLSTDVGVRVQRAQTDDAAQVTGGLSGLLGGGDGGALRPQSGESDGESESLVDVTVTNFGNTPVERIVLAGETTEGETLPSVGRIAVGDALAPGESATVTVDLSTVPAADGVRFVAGYDASDQRAESAAVYDYRVARGDATVTGLDVSVTEDGQVTVDGNLANTGDGEVTSAVVAVSPTEHVRPAYPQRDYFVGTVAGSEFAPFELTARADTANATAVTVRLDYAVGGDRVTDTVQVPLPPADDGDGRDWRTLGIGLAVVVALVVAVALALFVRRSRGR
ncbi:hypothetical protein [Haloarcula nitratireducens]|uniref:CARDB domain-containing protein n=1 Tax=Haloarcula nitratireducens TaxID=2487749 RepID=A0AAW4P791_9EURY|nr:hypothetical protein [Halomicroarcula nitratireducens]MBX0293621.1 hypothetical protein [Halomicroarcula nitratireducens]